MSVGPLLPPPVSFAQRRAMLPSVLGVSTTLLRTWHMAASLLLSVRTVILYADVRANAVFLLGDTSATAVGAELRGTCLPRGFGSQATSQLRRGMAPGSRKDLGYFSVSAPSAQAVVLCESVIDARCCHLLHPHYRCLSTSGARPNPAWLPSLIAKDLPLYCGFDADPTGDAIAQLMIQLHPSVCRLRPPTKDWNDALRLQSS